MMRVTYSSMHISRANFVFVPAMDFTRQWSDADLYNYFELTADEIALIEKTMRPME
jgi:site-specific DNA-methyltransferase (adenine-specific)